MQSDTVKNFFIQVYFSYENFSGESLKNKIMD